MNKRRRSPTVVTGSYWRPYPRVAPLQSSAACPDDRRRRIARWRVRRTGFSRSGTALVDGSRSSELAYGRQNEPVTTRRPPLNSRAFRSGPTRVSSASQPLRSLRRSTAVRSAETSEQDVPGDSLGVQQPSRCAVGIRQTDHKVIDVGFGSAGKGSMRDGIEGGLRIFSDPRRSGCKVARGLHSRADRRGIRSQFGDECGHLPSTECSRKQVKTVDPDIPSLSGCVIKNAIKPASKAQRKPKTPRTIASGKTRGHRSLSRRPSRQSSATERPASAAR